MYFVFLLFFCNLHFVFFRLFFLLLWLFCYYAWIVFWMNTLRILFALSSLFALSGSSPLSAFFALFLLLARVACLIWLSLVTCVQLTRRAQTRPGRQCSRHAWLWLWTTRSRWRPWLHRPPLRASGGAPRVSPLGGLLLVFLKNKTKVPNQSKMRMLPEAIRISAYTRYSSCQRGTHPVYPL